MPNDRWDRMGENFVRRVAGHTSRRGVLARIGALIAAAPALPLLPVARRAEAAPLSDFARNAQSKDPDKCTYWRYCALGGLLCTGCGGGVHTCPPGTQPSARAMLDA